MKFRRTTASTACADLRAFASFLEKNGSPEDLRVAASNMNDVLDQWRAWDAFGTEGQLDPRGDPRE